MFWTVETEEAFRKVKEALVSALILCSPDLSNKFCIQCDASSIRLGCVLIQEQDGVEKAIAFASLTLSKTERRYSVSDQKCVAVVFGIEKFRPCIEGVKSPSITLCCGSTK